MLSIPAASLSKDRSGLNGVVDTEDPLPISFLLTNNSQKIIEGNLFITSPASGDEVFLGEVTLAPSSTRRFPR